MGVKSDAWFRERCLDTDGQVVPAPMIDPFVGHLVSSDNGRKVISYGLSSYGYDLRCAGEFKIFTDLHGAVVDPKGIDERAFVDRRVVDGESILIPPNSFALARSVEYLRIPRDVLVLCAPKSSYARTGLLMQSTILEPGWEGHLTIEISNSTRLPARVHAGEGICQLVFIGADFELRNFGLRPPDVAASMRGGSPEGVVELRREVCETDYSDRGGKYQGQRGVTLPKV